jgi:hypothetical protein
VKGSFLFKSGPNRKELIFSLLDLTFSDSFVLSLQFVQLDGHFLMIIVELPVFLVKLIVFALILQGSCLMAIL